MEKRLSEIEGFEIETLSNDRLEEMKEVYICPSFSCNLNCPHCYLKNLPFHFDIEKVLKTISFISDKAGSNVFFDLFGGEPLLISLPVLKDIVYLMKKKRFVISTNLLKLKEEHLELFHNAEWINTSYNPKRFSLEQFSLWKKNLKILNENSIKINLMNTLTSDYIKEETSDRLCNFLNDFRIYSIDFDYLIGKNYPDSDSVCNFLIDLYNNWNTNCKFNIVESIRESISSKTVFKDCSNTYTILPNGKIKNGCAYCQGEKIRIECKLCDCYDFCNGACRLTEQCSFPKELFKLIKEKEFE